MGSAKPILYRLHLCGFARRIVDAGYVYAAERSAIYRFEPDGTALGLWSPISALVWLAASLDGSVVSSNGSGNLFRINPDGSMRVSRNTGTLGEPVARGVDVAPDQCR